MPQNVNDILLQRIIYQITYNNKNMLSFELSRRQKYM